MGNTNTTQHLVAAKLTADAGQFSAEFIRAARGIDAFKTQTGQAFTEVGKSALNFDKIMTHAMGTAVVASKSAASAAHQMAAGAVNFSAGPLNSARAYAQQSSFMQRGVEYARGAYQNTTGSMMAMGLGIGGTAGVMSAAAKSRDFNRKMADLMIKGDKDTDWAKAAERQILAVSNATGKGRDEVQAYADMYVTLTGNVDVAMQTMAKMGRVAVATDVQMADLAQVAEQLGGSLKVQPGDIYGAMNILSQQEKSGKVPFKAMAGQLGKVTSVLGAGTFGEAGMGLAGTAAAGGLFQIAARGFGAGQEGEVATSSGRFLTMLSKNRKGIEKAFGVSLGKEVGGKFVWDALPEVFKKVGAGVAARSQDTKLLNKLFMDEAFKVAMQLAVASRQGWGTSDAATGRVAASEIFGASAKKDIISVDAAKREQSLAHRWDAAVNKMSNQLHVTMLPVLEKMVQAMPSVAKAVDFLLTNSKELLAFWLSGKGLTIFRGLAGMAGGGGGGVGAAAGAGAGMMAMGGMGGFSRGAAAAGAGVAAAGAMAWGGSFAASSPAGRGGSALASRIIPGSDLDLLRQERQAAIAARNAKYTQAATGALSSLPLLPLAYAGGKWFGGKLNRLMGGQHDSLEGADAAYDQARLEREEGIRRRYRQKSRGIRSFLARMDLSDWYSKTQQGAVIRREAAKDWTESGTTRGQDAYGRDDGYVVPVGDIYEKRGKSGLEALRDRMSGYRGSILTEANQSLVDRGFVPGTKEYDSELKKIAPELGKLSSVITALEQTLARIESGNGIQLHATVHVPDPNSPGGRVEARGATAGVTGAKGGIGAG